MSLKQSEKASFPILETVSGIVMLFKLLQALNALSPILTTLLGIVRSPVKPLHPEKASEPIVFTPLGMIRVSVRLLQF